MDRLQMLEENRARADEVRSELAERQANCVHRDDGLLSDWSETMPKKSAAPALTADDVADITTMIVRAELAEHTRKITGTLDTKITDYHEGSELRPVTRETLVGMAEKIFNEITVEATEIDKVRREFDLQQRSGDRATVIDHPSARRA
jgi:hypothetical protein